MRDEDYYSAIAEVDGNLAIEHGSWKNHKYVDKVGGKYIYPEDIKNKQKEYAEATAKTDKKAARAEKVKKFTGDSITSHGINAVTSSIAKLASDAMDKSVTKQRAENAALKAEADGMARTQKTREAMEVIAANKKEAEKANAQNMDWNEYMDKMAVAYIKERLGEISDELMQEGLKAKEKGDAAFMAWINEQAVKGVKKVSSMSHAEFNDEVDSYVDYLEHHGILGMKWGIRRYQNPDGSLTELGRKHLADGKTQKEIDKWEQKKSTALAKGDVEFAKKNMDYLSNNELQAFKERIAARTSLDDLKQASRKITADKLQTWANMAQSGANLLNNGINAYNSAAKIVNGITGKKTIPILKDIGGDDKKETKSIFETWENGKKTKMQTQYTDANGNKHDITENWKTEEKRPETIKSAYDETTGKKTVTRTYTDDNGNNVTDSRTYDASVKPAQNNPYSEQYDKVRSGYYNSGKQNATQESTSSAKGVKGLPWNKEESKVYSGTVEGKGSSEGTHKGFGKTNAERAESAQDASYRNADPVSNSKSSWSSAGTSSMSGFKDFKNNMSDKERNIINDVDDYTDELFRRNQK